MKFKLSLTEAASMMKEREFVNILNRKKWHSIISDHGSDLLVGEIRNSKDWENLPLNKKLRAVYMEDQKGPVIRWSDTEGLYQKTGRFFSHNKLATFEPSYSKIGRSGWIITKKDGEIIIK